MADPDRTVAGVRCREVLDDLSDLLDGSLSGEREQQIRRHVEACDWCERFGGQFSSVVSALKRTLAGAEPLPGSVKLRLRDRVRDQIHKRG